MGICKQNNFDFAPVSFAAEVQTTPARNNQTSSETPSMHPEEHDSGTVALIAIAVLTTILVIASIVSLLIPAIASKRAKFPND